MFDFTFFLTDSHAIMLALALIAALAVLCLYYGFFHFRLGIWHRKGIVAEGSSSDTKLPPVSVVLTARNDAAWLKENLVYLLEQDYPDFEVVVVDYLSHDDTQFVLKLLKDYYPHLKVVPFKEDVNLPVTDKVYSQIISLPMHPELSNEEQDIICNLINTL